MKHHSEKQNPASKPQTKNMLNAGLARAGNSAYPDHAPSQKFRSQSAGIRRQGDNTYPDYPDTSISNGFESTGSNWAGSKKGSR
jgi:hypothetical protein